MTALNNRSTALMSSPLVWIGVLIVLALLVGGATWAIADCPECDGFGWVRANNGLASAITTCPSCMGKKKVTLLKKWLHRQESSIERPDHQDMDKDH